MARPRTRKTWDGGYIHTKANGGPLFFIEKRRGNEKFHISTGCSRPEEAQEHWKRFQADPWRYAAEMKTGRPADDAALFMTEELVMRFCAWHLAKGNTRKYVKETGKLLKDWLRALAHVDLRRATLRDHIKPPLEKWTMRGPRIRAIKVFYSWLREEAHLLTSANDPTLDMPAPQAIPEKRKRTKAVAREVFELVLTLLSTQHRDILSVMAHTGMHFTELCRLVRDPRSDLVRTTTESTLAVAEFLHKNKELTYHPFTDENAIQAAERLRKHGIGRDISPLDPTNKRLRPNAAIKLACEKLGVPVFKLGVVRHSVGTWLVQMGWTEGQVADFLHHKDKRTTQRFYLDVKVPTTPTPVPALRVLRPVPQAL